MQNACCAPQQWGVKQEASHKDVPVPEMITGDDPERRAVVKPRERLSGRDYPSEPGLPGLGLGTLACCGVREAGF